MHLIQYIYHQWIRLDARGNKEGIKAEFSVGGEYLAFPIRKEYQEIDYEEIYSEPHIKTMQVLEENNNCLDMYLKFLPDSL